MKPGDLAAAKAAADQLFDADEKARELLGSLAPGFYTKLYTNSTRRLEMTTRHEAKTAPITRTGWIICRPHPIGNGNYNAEMGYAVLFETEEKARDALGELWGWPRYQIAKVEWVE